MRLEVRYDVGTLRPARVNAQGFLVLDGHASRVGVQSYRLANGSTRRELRLPEDVQNDASLAGFEGIVITDDHPDTMVTAKNARSLQAGFVQGPGTADGELVKVGIVITDALLIDKVKRGKRQLSVGYNVDLEMTPGTHPTYGEYDAIQRNIRPNHLAVVDEGRAGPRASLHLDASRGDASVAISVEHEWSWATLYVSSRELSANDLVAKCRELLSGFEGLAITSEGYTGDSIEVGMASLACARIASRDLSAREMDEKIRPLLEGTEKIQIGQAQVTANDFSAHTLHIAGRVPHSARDARSHQVNLEQALAALNETNVKLGAATLRADTAERALLTAEQARKDAEQARSVAEANAVQARKDADAEKAATEQARKDAEAKIAEANAKIEQARKDAQAQTDADVADRVDTLTQAALILPKADDKGQVIDRSKMTTRDLKAAIVKHVDGDDVAADAIPQVVDVMFRGAVGRHAKGAQALGGVRTTIEAQRQQAPVIITDTRAAEQVAKDKNSETVANRWQQPLTASKDAKGTK